jgi:hypothetical protein
LEETIAPNCDTLDQQEKNVLSTNCMRSSTTHVWMVCFSDGLMDSSSTLWWYFIVDEDWKICQQSKSRFDVLKYFLSEIYSLNPFSSKHGKQSTKELQE